MGTVLVTTITGPAACFMKGLMAVIKAEDLTSLLCSASWDTTAMNLLPKMLELDFKIYTADW